MVRVLIVYHSKTGNTEKMAKAIAEGVNLSGAEAILKRVEDASIDDLDDIDGLILGSPTYFGTMSAEMKRFIDQSVKKRKKLENKIGAAFSSSNFVNGGNETTIISLIQALLVHGMVVAGDPLETGGHFGVVSIKDPDEKTLERCRKFGKRIGELATRLTSNQ
ncbi:MAG: flavodoxin family protein [Candidatus Methanoliparum thermophilum]|uniref:Flavodoxin family protein n=1 Tax=Methanoliparum thermophilum TaxID=2491083 RepID=A0A520KTY6_METT2|nr:NAD(P)H-dependent oxidoreductase [Candidatus Methanoliparum sp. LAM-1]RZN65542.1 MAG: flavodoxin family protein [Candidatus Methanoliparum thermophilum]BDC35361.1 flavodoxin [Candidatus Methanoliparum sp. LAM-1]